jgi:hypothetical protein
MAVLFDGGAEFQIILVRCLSLLFHLPLLIVTFPSNVIMVISNMISLVMFDYLENPYDIDITTLIEFEEYDQDEIDKKVYG